MGRIHLCILLTLFFCLKSRAQSVCPHQRFGNNCQDGCHCYNSQQCTSKSCACADGWKGTGCNEVCPHQRFGNNCQDGCHCYDSQQCTSKSCACADGWKGTGCNEVCPHKRNGNKCQDGCHCKYSSHCTSETCTCAAGWIGTGCNEVCPHVRFGNNCQDGCHCNDSQHCIYETCHCASGWKGIDCNEECSTGKFGYYCGSSCHCEDNSKCNKINGKCHGVKCEKGYTGRNCQTLCPHNRYGNKCQNGCHCKYSSHCTSETCTCAAGWIGTGCNEECSTGKFGYYCRSSCHCEDNSKCNKTDGRCHGVKCEKGYTGRNCQTLCPHNRYGNKCQNGCHCKYSSHCTSETCTCAAGWIGTGCNEECSTGKFDYYCRSSCHCEDNSKCNKTDGRCHGVKCEKGYTGRNCQTLCPHQRYGNKCQDGCHCKYSSHCTSETCTCAAGWIGTGCNEECLTGSFGKDCLGECKCVNISSCNKIDGKCHGVKCKKGYTGGKCQKPCGNGTFGDDCQLKCHCTNNSQCNHVNGKCPHGKCAEGYKGDNCQEVKFGLILPLVLAAVLIIIISIGVLIACYRWRKSKRRNHCNNQESENNIPMERGNFQETEENAREDFDSNNIYQNVALITKYNLLSYVEQNKLEEVPFSNEFSRLLKNAEFPCEAGTLSENHSKNRYKSILPYDHSRVILSSSNSDRDYINANYIKDERTYIATQGPLKSTTKDFWRMIWELKCNTIVMLTNIVENGKAKCYSYWPDLNETENAGTFQISCIQEDHCMIYTHRVLTITQASTQEERRVHHFQCTIWPDYGVIEEPTFFLEFRNAIRHSRFSEPPFVVHCSAGVGRTGTYIALDILLEQLWNEPNIDIFSCVNQLRHQRISMVQKIKQYQFIYDVLAEEVLTGFSEISVNSVADEFRQLQEMEADGKSRLQNEYTEFLSPLNQPDQAASNNQEPIYINIKLSNVFGTSHESLPEPTFLDGFNMKDEIMLMPQPSKNTAQMFWKFIYKKRCSIIVTLDDSSNSVSGVFSTDIDCIDTYKSISVKMTENIDRRVYRMRNYQVSSTKQNTLGPVNVNHFTCKIWPGQHPPLPSGLIEFINMVNNCCGPGKQLLILCNDGITKSGLFAILCVMISKMKMNEQISILRLVRYAKKKNPQIASDDDAYKLCWSIAEKFHDNTSIYGNEGSFRYYS